MRYLATHKNNSIILYNIMCFSQTKRRNIEATHAMAANLLTDTVHMRKRLNRFQLSFHLIAAPPYFGHTGVETTRANNSLQAVIRKIRVSVFFTIPCIYY